MGRLAGVLAFAIGMSCTLAVTSSAQDNPAVQQGDYVAHDFHFRSGESLAEMKLHYRTLGSPHRNAQGHVDNAVMIMHGTGGSGAQFLAPYFAGVLFGPGQLLDSAKYYIILPDDIGHGGSSKPSDGMHARFPHYDYDDMVAAEHLLLTERLHVDHLRLTMGTSMGCMHSWMWGETYPRFSDALMPLACLPVPIAGRNRMMRKMAMNAITDEPEWKGGDYTTQPPGLRTALEMLLIMASSPLQMQEHAPTRDEADAYLKKFLDQHLAATDANDFLYAFNSSRNYDPSAKLETIQVPVMAVNSADDFVNPPELNIMPGMIKRVPKGKFVLLPVTEQTRGHGTHTMAAVWQGYLAELLQESAH
jgi:homoserine O-acetyltransferase/O-succinyltransferase